MKSFIRNLPALTLLLLVCAAPTFAGCEGSDADKAAKEAVEELSGKNIVEKGEKIKQQIDAYSTEQIEKIQQDIYKGTYSKDREAEDE